MALKKLTLKPGINRENTRYTQESGWYVCDKVRFRQGTPEKIGGWRRISEHTYLGVCRSLWNWLTLDLLNLLGIGTSKKFYLELGGEYNDITPLRVTTALPNNPFTATLGSSVITVNAPLHGAITGDYVTYVNALGLGGNVTAVVLNQEYEIDVVDANSYTITVAVTANAADVLGSPGGGGSVDAAYQISVGPEIQVPTSGWGSGPWGSGPWGTGLPATQALRMWSQSNFGEDLIFSYRGGAIYYWDATSGTSARGVLLSSLSGATDVPTVQSFIFVSDISRFVFAFGANDYGDTVQDPMLVRWTGQDTAVDWTPAATNQAGSIRLSHGSELITALQTRQEIVVWSDSAVYSFQYVGPPAAWSHQLLGDNISLISPNAVALASGIVYWMGKDKFYVYDGSVKTLPCDLLRHVFGNINYSQALQSFAGTNEGFNEVWWYYCSAGSTEVDKYVVYNYTENVWYYGTLGRTAWLDSGLRTFPLAATYSNNIVTHEDGIDDNETGTTAAINAYVESAEFDLDDGDHFGFVYRMLPDVTFDGSTATAPTGTLTLIPMKDSGSGYNDPQSEGGSSYASVVRTTTVPIEQFTGQVYIRVRGRQMIFKFESNQIGCQWQLGSPRIDVRPDGRR